MKLQISSHNSGTKTLTRNKETTGFALTVSYPWWLGVSLYATNRLRSRCGDTSDLGKDSHQPPQTSRYGNLRDSCNLPQLPLPNQTFRILPLCFKPTQGCQICVRVLRDARWIGGLTKVVIYPACTNSLQKVAVHAALIQGPRDIRQWTTQLSCKQLNWHQLSIPKITLDTCSWTNKEHFPLKMYSHSSRGTEVAATEGQWLLHKWLNCTAAKNPDNSLELMCASPYILPTLYVRTETVMLLIDIMIICFPLLVGKTLCMCSRVMPTDLHICQHPCQTNLTVLIATHKPTYQFCTQFPSLWDR